MKRIFLTGASSGIGLEIARRLSSRGFEVWGTSRELARLPQFERFHPVQMDLGISQSIEAVFSSLLQKVGGFDVLINNAGAGQFGPIEGGAEDHDRLIFAVLLHAPIQLIRRVLPEMRKRRNGMIVNVTSLAVDFPIPFMASYSAAKAALSSYTEMLRLELRNSGVKISEVRPGDIQTGFNDAIFRTPVPMDGFYEKALSQAWDSIDRNMKKAPLPGCVAEAVVRMVESKTPSPLLRVGECFQAAVAPLAARLSPQSLIERSIRKYYGL